MSKKDFTQLKTEDDVNRYLIFGNYEAFEEFGGDVQIIIPLWYIHALTNGIINHGDVPATVLFFTKSGYFIGSDEDIRRFEFKKDGTELLVYYENRLFEESVIDSKMVEDIPEEDAKLLADETVEFFKERILPSILTEGVENQVTRRELAILSEALWVVNVSGYVPMKEEV